MSPSTARTLAGAPDRPLHLAEYTFGATDNVLPPLAPSSPGENFLLLLGLAGPPARCRALDLGWHLEPDTLVWLRHAAPVHLRSAGLRPASLLAWRFTAGSLPAEVADLVLGLPIAARPLAGPRPCAPAEVGLILGLRSCPVAPSLRGHWATAKLVEFLTHLLPSAETDDHSALPVDASALPAAVKAALMFMETHLAEPVGLAELAAAAGQSPAHFSRIFSEALGHGPTAHLRRLRMDHAARLLSAGAANVTEAAFSCGYQSLGQFSRVFTEHHGRPPSAFLP